MKLAVFISALFLVAGISSSQAGSICKAAVLRDVPALEDPKSILGRGDYDEVITQYRVDKKTGATSFCSHGGYCYPTHITEDGNRVEALRLTNCKIGKRDPFDDPDEVIYDVDVIRSKVSPTELKILDLENELINLKNKLSDEIGLCNACADNVADLYIKKPASRCAQLTKKALDGDPVAIEKLNEFPEYCKAW